VHKIVGFIAFQSQVLICSYNETPHSVIFFHHKSMQLFGRMCLFFLTSLSVLQQTSKPRAADQNITGCLSHNVCYKTISRTEDHPTKYCGICVTDTTIFLGTDVFLSCRCLKPLKTQVYSNRYWHRNGPILAIT
jgi:hypothetical protein